MGPGMMPRVRRHECSAAWRSTLNNKALTLGQPITVGSSDDRDKRRE